MRRGPYRAAPSGNFLQTMRLKAGLTQKQLAEQLEVDDTFISKVERLDHRRKPVDRQFILGWAMACRVGPKDPVVQQFLLESGHAPWLLDSNANAQLAAFAAQVASGFGDL